MLHQVNTTRTGLKGVNHRPLPPGAVTTHADGRMTVAASGGRHYGVRPNGTLASFSGHNEQVRFRPNGRVIFAHTPNMDIQHGVHGGRTVVVHRPNHTVIVRSGPRMGYVQHTVTRNNTSYVQRTYANGPTVYTRSFANYNYRGVELPNYMPAAYYAPEFYGWAYYPWAAPVPYAWDWTSSPWYDFFNSYFTAAGAYPSPSAWLTDYYLGQLMADAYQEQDQAEQMDPQDYASDEQAAADQVYAETTSPITPELKQAIADEVQRQLSYENAASQKPADSATLTALPQVLQSSHVFVVGSTFDVSTADNRYCELAPGNVLVVAGMPAVGAAAATMQVAASRSGGCPAGTLVSVSFAQLQEMQNSFRASLDSGLKVIHDGQGKNGLPAAPKSAIAPPPRAAPGLPPAPQENIQALLQAADTEASRTENQVTQAAFAAPQTAKAKQ